MPLMGVLYAKWEGNTMKAKTTESMEDDLRPEYEFDFSQAERGRYARRLKTEGSNLVMIETNLAKAFPDSTSGNMALRSVLGFTKCKHQANHNKGG